jgi:hypothetical protein
MYADASAHNPGTPAVMLGSLIAHADREQKILPSATAGELQTGGQTRFAQTVGQEESGHAAHVGRAPDAGAARIVRIDLVERGVERPGHRGQRRRGDRVHLGEQPVERRSGGPPEPEGAEVVLGRKHLPRVPPDPVFRRGQLGDPAALKQRLEGARRLP